MTSFSFSSKQRRNASVAAISTIAVIAIATVVFKTYPHLKSKLFGKDDDDDKTVSDSTVVVDNNKETSDWSDDELKSFLVQKQVSVPESATHDELVALVTKLQ